MVRKVILILCIMSILLLLFLPCSAASPYYGSISSTYLTYAKDVVSNHFWKDYVFFRSDYETYSLAIGDLDYSGNRFVGEVDIYNFVSVRNTDNQSYIMYTVTSDSNFELTCSNLLIYSNLGGYPALMSSDVINTYAILSVLIIICIFGFVTNIFRSCRR